MPVATAITYDQCLFGTAVEVWLGFHCAPGTNEVRFDDVVVDYP